ncbi:MAG: glucose-6-phosphate isomerase [Deltaproteobacteria bacterium]|nr:glucose-6-phosphate isomerase [Deltaproteobacteria bacterium]
MTNSFSPYNLPSEKKLAKHFNKIKNTKIKDLFEKDHRRFEKFSIKNGDLFTDYSKNLITEKTLELLLQFADQSGLKQAIEDMFCGEKINVTEQRAVLHTAARSVLTKENPITSDGEEITAGLRKIFEKMASFTKEITNGTRKGSTGKAFTHIINIGIGGSELGPKLLVSALKTFGNKNLKIKFISSPDPSHTKEILKQANPEATLFIIVSKSFTTKETLINYKAARKWLLNSGIKKKNLNKHFAAVSENKKEALNSGILPDYLFKTEKFINGRCGIWSGAGLCPCILLGADLFADFLSGAYEIDNSFRHSPFEKNLPVILGLIDIWHRNFFKTATWAIFPYEQALANLPFYVAQLCMESNGKSVNRQGEKINYASAPIVWGMPAPNAQHSCFQSLHQGTNLAPIDLLSPALAQNGEKNAEILAANHFAQAEVLMNGASDNEIYKTGASKNFIKQTAAHKTLRGNRPSISFIYKKLTPKLLGKLIATYEHRIFVQGILWNIFSFDQWGVEAGKRMADKILSALTEPKQDEKQKLNSSTAGLINIFKRFQSDEL